MIDYLIVGSGLFGSTIAYLLNKHGYKCMVIEKRKHYGGNLYCEDYDGINVHAYGPHIFHTSDKKIWDFVNQFVEFNNYVNEPLAYCGIDKTLYHLPFNMDTFNRMWNDVITPQQAKEKINSLVKTSNPTNFEEQAISLVGEDIYKKLIKGIQQVCFESLKGHQNRRFVNVFNASTMPYYRAALPFRQSMQIFHDIDLEQKEMKEGHFDLAEDLKDD